MRLGETIPVPKNSAHRMPTRLFCLVATLGLILSSTATHAQDWIRTGTGLGVEKVRLAAADFKRRLRQLATAGSYSKVQLDLIAAGIMNLAQPDPEETDPHVQLR